MSPVLRRGAGDTCARLVRTAHGDIFEPLLLDIGDHHRAPLVCSPVVLVQLAPSCVDRLVARRDFGVVFFAVCASTSLIQRPLTIRSERRRAVAVAIGAPRGRRR